MVFSAWWVARILKSPWERRLHLRRAAPRGGLARGGWRSAVALDVGVLRNELASSSPCGDERAAGPTRFLSLERVLSSVVLAFLSPRSVIGIGRARCNSARRAAGFACVCFAMRRRVCCGAYPRFYRSGAFWAFPAFLSSRLALGAGGVCYGTAGLGGGWHLRRPPRRRGGGRWGRRLVWADGAVARARLWRFSLSPCVDRGAHRRVTVLEDSARTAVGVLSSAARWQSGHLLRAPGRGSAFLRRPRSVLMRRTGHFLVGFEGRPTFVQHSRAVDVADRKSGRDLSAFWRSLAVVVPPARLRCTLAARWAG